MKIVIVEDEYNNVQLILAMLKLTGLPYEVVGVADNVEDAVETIREKKPHLVLMDIMIKEGTGFEVLETLREDERTFQLIFITAYNQYAINAIKKHAFDYILKPIQSTEFRTSLRACYERIEADLKLKVLLETDNKDFSYQVKTYSGTELITEEQIICFEAEGSYTNCRLEDRTILVSKNIGEIEKEVPADTFFRCHHSYLINIKHISSIEPGRSGNIICSNGISIPVAQRKKKEFMEFIRKH